MATKIQALLMSLKLNPSFFNSYSLSLHLVPSPRVMHVRIKESKKDQTSDVEKEKLDVTFSKKNKASS